MTFCAWCGAEIPPGDGFCSRCGRSVVGHFAPAPPDPTIPVLITVIVAVLVVAFALAALYEASLPVPSRSGLAKPAVTLTVSPTVSGEDILVAAIQPTAPPSDFRVNIEDVSAATYGTAAALPTMPYGNVGVVLGTGATQVVFSLQWQNPGGSGVVSQGDHFVITATGAYTSGTTYAFFLIWTDGSTLASVSWTG